MPAIIRRLTGPWRRRGPRRCYPRARRPRTGCAGRTSGSSRCAGAVILSQRTPWTGWVGGGSVGQKGAGGADRGGAPEEHGAVRVVLPAVDRHDVVDRPQPLEGQAVAQRRLRQRELPAEGVRANPRGGEDEDDEGEGAAEEPAPGDGAGVARVEGRARAGAVAPRHGQRREAPVVPLVVAVVRGGGEGPELDLGGAVAADGAGDAASRGLGLEHRQTRGPLPAVACQVPAGFPGTQVDDRGRGRIFRRGTLNRGWRELA